MKNIKKILCFIMIVFITFSYKVKAENVEFVSFESLLGSKFTSTTQANFTNAGGARKEGTYGIRISLVEWEEGKNPQTKLVYDIFTKNNSTYKVDSKKNKLNYSSNYYEKTGTISTLPKVTTDGNSWNLNFSGITNKLKIIEDSFNTAFADQSKTLSDFKLDLNDADYYKLIMELVKNDATLKQKYECSVMPGGTCYNYKNAKKYIKTMNKLYILVEPISTVAFGSSNAWRGDIPLSDNEISKIKGIGKLNSEYNGNDRDKLDELFIYLGLMDNAYFKDKLRPLYYLGSCSSFDSAVCQSYAYGLNSYIRDWNKLVDQVNNISITYYTGTSTNIATKVLNSYNSDSTKKLRGISKKGNLQGSIEENVKRIAEYFYGVTIDTKFPKFTESTSIRSWEALVNDKYSLGVQIIHANFDKLKFINGEACTYEKGKLYPPEGKEEKDCCLETDLWDDYDDISKSSEQWKSFFKNTTYYYKICPICTKENYNDLINIDKGTINEADLITKLPGLANKDSKYCCYSKNYTDDEKNKFENKNKFVGWTDDGKLNIDYCKGTDTNNDKYCVWNGNNTERWQTINKELVDCCNYENWGKTNNEREQALKNADKNKTVTKYVFENEIPWYSNTCVVPVPQYCTIQKLESGDTSCCHGTGNYSPSFINEMQSNGYSNTEAGLEEYLKYKIGVNKYNRLCDAPCSYEIESLCPDCSNEDTSYGLVMDRVSGFDSTALKLSNETEQCIFKNNEYLYEKNSYCEVYCTEKLEYSFPKKSTLSVTAGTRLVVGGNLSPMESKSTITCRRTEINTAKFESDLKGKIDALKTAYKEYTYASVPLNENKINTTVIGSSKTDTRCECRNYQSGLEDGRCCDGKGTYTKAATLTNTITFANTDKVYYDYSAPTSSSSCGSQGGTWHPEDNTPIPNPNAGKSTTECVKYYTKGKNKGQCKEYGKEPATLPHTEPAYCSGYSPRPYCSGSFTYNGTTCVTTSSTANCSLSGNTWTCKDYSCSSTTSVGNETGTLTSASSFRTTESNPTCTYAYCSSRNYDRYNFQTVDAYRYGYNKSEPQSAQGKICENESGYYQTKYENEKAIKKQALLAAWNDYNNVINNLNICYNFTNKVKSNYEININLSYQNGSYSIDTPLDKTVSTYTDKNFTQTESTRGYKNCGIMTGIEFLNCEQETKYYQENINGTYAAGTSTNTYSYTLPNNSSMYRYVNKSSLSEKNSNINSIYIGSHLPVAYNEKDNKIEVELTPSVIKSNLSGTTYITKQRNNFESEICTDPYACDAVTPGKTKIIPVYRVISLNNPFPDEDGNGRNTGKNWCNGSDCTNNNQVVQNVIKNNRGVSEDKVYTLTPLYTLVLTPGTIKKIREYNSQTSYGDYSLICEKDTGKYCKSLYLRGEPDKEGNIIDNNLEQIGVLKKDKSCAFNEELAGCMPGDKYEG